MQLSFPTLQVSPLFGVHHRPADVIAAIADAGWSAIGVDLDLVTALGDEAGGLTAEAADVAVAQLLVAAGLRGTDVAVLVLHADLAAVVARARRLAALADAIGAHHCVIAFADGAQALDPASAQALDLLATCSEILGAVGVRGALEFVPYGPLTTLAAARALCAAVGPERCGLLVDSWHVIVGGSLDELSALTADEIALVQFSDAAPPPTGADLATHSRERRELPGAGRFDLGGFVAAVAATGYDGVVSPEILSVRWRRAPLAEFATELHRRSAALWGAHLSGGVDSNHHDD